MSTADSSIAKNPRLYLLGAVMLLWCVAICGRLVYLQIFSYGKFVKQAGHQQQRAIPLTAKRGVIYDRDGHELAMSVMVDSAFAVPTAVPTPKPGRNVGMPRLAGSISGGHCRYCLETARIAGTG